MQTNTEASIAIDGLELTMKKGLYPSEKLLENKFLLSARVGYAPSELKKGEYLNYERLAEIMDAEMKKDVLLLETIAENILNEFLLEWPLAHNAFVRIEKRNPAFSTFRVAAVVVEMRKDR